MRPTLTCAAAALLLATASAQSGLEPGYGVYSRFYDPATAPTLLGGLVVFHPYDGLNVDVTGLPDVLTGNGYTTTSGSNAVLVRNEDGALLVTAIYYNVPAVIYEVMLDGTAAQVTRQYTIGPGSAFATIDQMAWLPGNRVLFTHAGVNNPALDSQGLGILDLTTGAVSSVTINNFPAGRYMNACAVDPTGTTAYFGTYGGGGGIYSVPVAGGDATPIPGWDTSPSAIQQLAVAPDGMLYVGPGWGIAQLMEIDPVTGQTTYLVDMGGTLNGLFIEPVTGDYIFARYSNVAGTSSLFWWNENQGTTPITVPGMAGVEGPTGIGIRASLLPCGDGAPGTKQWQVYPNAGGAPQPGNTQFSLTVTSPSRSSGLMMFAAEGLAAPINTFLFRNLLLDPGNMLPITRFVPRSTEFTVHLPITPCLLSEDLYAQVLTFRFGLPPFQGGEGLWVHIYD